MSSSKMVNIAKIEDFESLSKETGISVADLKAMQRELKSGTMALPRANERQETSLASLMETHSNTTDFQSQPTERPDGTYDISNIMKEGEDMYVNGKQVDPMTIETETDDFDTGMGPVEYAVSARYMDGSILGDTEIEMLNNEYFEDKYVNPEDYYDADRYVDDNRE